MGKIYIRHFSCYHFRRNDTYNLTEIDHICELFPLVRRSGAVPHPVYASLSKSGRQLAPAYLKGLARYL